MNMFNISMYVCIPSSPYNVTLVTCALPQRGGIASVAWTSQVFDVLRFCPDDYAGRALDCYCLAASSLASYRAENSHLLCTFYGNFEVHQNEIYIKPILFIVTKTFSGENRYFVVLWQLLYERIT